MQHVKIQDPTGVMIEYARAAFLGWTDAQLTLPANGTRGYATGCMLIDSVTGEEYINTGSDTSCTFVARSALTLGIIPLPLNSFRAIAANEIPALAGTPASGILASDTLPKFKRANTSTDKALKIEWAASSVIEVTSDNIVVPLDFDITKASTLNLITKMGGATDTPVIAVNVFPGLGGADAGGNTSASATTLGIVTLAIAANKFLVAPNNFASISLVPGAHTTDVLQLYGGYITYTKKLLSG